MKNGIINNIDVDNIFASQDRSTFFIPVNINVANITDDIFVSCFIKRKYYSTQSKPTHLNNAYNLSKNIEFDQIKGNYDFLTRKLFSKNVSIKSGQSEEDNQKILVNKPSAESEDSTTIFLPIKKTTLSHLFGVETDQNNEYSHIFSVYVTNKENNVVEISSSEQNSINPFDYLKKPSASRNVLQTVLDRLTDSVRITITPFFHRRANFSNQAGLFGAPKSLSNSGINLNYNNTILKSLNSFFNFEALFIHIKCNDKKYKVNSTNINRINFLLLKEEKFISDVLNLANALEDTQTLDFEITFDYVGRSIRDDDARFIVESTKIFQVESLKLKKIKESFYTYYKYKYFQEGNFFRVKDDGSDILIEIDNEIVDSNKELYNMLSNVSIIFRVNVNTIKTKLFFSKGSTKGISTIDSFLFKNIVAKSFNKLYIKNASVGSLKIQCIIPQLDLEGREIKSRFDIYPSEQESIDGDEETNDSDESSAAEAMAESTSEEE